MTMYEAADTGNVEFPDGSQVVVVKGQSFHHSTRLVKHLGTDGPFLRKVEEPPEDEKPAPKRRGT